MTYPERPGLAGQASPPVSCSSHALRPVVGPASQDCSRSPSDAVRNAPQSRRYGRTMGVAVGTYDVEQAVRAKGMEMVAPAARAASARPESMGDSRSVQSGSVRAKGRPPPCVAAAAPGGGKSVSVRQTSHGVGAGDGVGEGGGVGSGGGGRARRRPGALGPGGEGGGGAGGSRTAHTGQYVASGVSDKE